MTARPLHPIRQEVLAEIRRVYQKAAPDKVQQAVRLIDRYPADKWHQMLRMIGHKYGQAIDPTILASTAATCPTHRATGDTFEASMRDPESSHHNVIGRALALLLPVLAVLLFDGQLDATDAALTQPTLFKSGGSGNTECSYLRFQKNGPWNARS